MLTTIKKYFLKRKIRHHAASIEGCHHEAAKIEEEISEHEKKLNLAARQLREIEIPVRIGSAFK